MNRQAVDLGFILKQIPEYRFSMDEFEDRLKLQKTLYILQIFGVYLGYDFSWYLRGPYCSALTGNGFELQEIYDKIPNETIGFRNATTQGKFENFRRFIDNKSTDDLEIIASLHYLKTTKTMSDVEIINKITDKVDRFKSERVKEMWKELKKYELIS